MPSKITNFVHELINSSTDENGVIVESLVVEVLAGLRECNIPKHRQILKEYLAEIEKTLHQQLVEIELGSELNQSLISALQDKISSFSSNTINFKVSTNKNLIAGYRVRIVDDVFEDSIQSRLSKLSQSFTS
jgi:F0F1-type ATP synthase delta subunit